MPLLYRPQSRHEYVHRDKPTLPGGPRAQGVEPDSSLLAAREDLGDGFLVFGREGSVEQTLRGVTQQSYPCPHDVRCDGESDQGVERKPPGELREGYGEYHA